METAEMVLKYHAIESLLDPAYDDWLDLMQQSFPLGEQMLVSSVNKILRARTEGKLVGENLVLVQNAADDAPIGMAMYETVGESGVLWYLAANASIRSQGLGARIYRRVVDMLLEDENVKAVFLEVEDPEEDQTHDVEMARRRIGFYRRNGMRLFGGIHYVQSVGWQPPMVMRLMVAPRDGMDAETAFALASEVFGAALTRTGELTLD